MTPADRRPLFPSPARRAFSLVELLAVVAIMVILFGLLAPSINTMTSTAGRKGAVNILMNTLEQARAAALESGCNVYVLLWRREFPQSDAIMVLREPSPWNVDKSGAPEKDLVPLTRWMKLPEGVLLYDGKGDNVFKAGMPGSLASYRHQIPKAGGERPQDANLGFVWYTPYGSIRQPLDKQARIILTEGVRGVGGTEARIADRRQAQGGGFDVISLSRFTGRARLDVTTLD